MRPPSILRVGCVALALGGLACAGGASPKSGTTDAAGGDGGNQGAAGAASGASSGTGGVVTNGAAGTAGGSAGVGGDQAGAAGAAGTTGESGASGTAGADGGHASDDAGTASDVTTERPTTSDAGASSGKQVLIWVWQSYASTLASVAANAKSFTHVSPALYQINYAYQSGVAKLVNGNDNFDGLTSKQVTQKIHDAGLKSVPLMYGGSGNSGTDQGIQNVLNDAPAGAQQSFIDSMVAEAKAKGHDGYNLDWEVDDTGYAAYGTKLIAFLTSFKGALNAAGLTLSFDLGGWYVRQCSSSGGDGLVDLAQLQHSVDLAIIEDYAGSFGSATATCPATNPRTESCDGDFLTQLGVMCNLPRDVVSIGVISPGTNPFAADALAAVTRWGWRNVAVWPDADQFLDASKMPAGATWYSVLASWLAQ
jgi:hypothetical protein